jgi:hypothetical protein
MKKPFRPLGSKRFLASPVFASVEVEVSEWKNRRYPRPRIRRFLVPLGVHTLASARRLTVNDVIEWTELFMASKGFLDWDFMRVVGLVRSRFPVSRER